ncbi:MAG: triose-phosphate isomerase [Clostridiales bacterium]|jgi:triosephosphate isomerase|nr:triose-phosphate isomerase [Clostridiales bacterium]
MRKPFIAGNWKMFKNIKEAKEFSEEFLKLYVPSDVQVAICAPYTQLSVLVDSFKGTGVKVGAQNMHYEDNGAYTGEISANMLKEIGVDYCIIGHSERRQYFGETDETVNKKLIKAFEYNILPILCVGEKLEERDSGREYDVVKTQLIKAFESISEAAMEKLTVAYEPVWAIGTGRTATPEQANEMCGYIRSVITELYSEEIADKVIIQYGGSVKPSNISELMNMYEIDGALVGGASLKPTDLIEIVNF